MVKIKVRKKVGSYKRKSGKVKRHKQTYYVDKDFNTIYVQKPSGLMAGRKTVKGKGDKTAVIRSYRTGRIVGRSPKLTSNIKRIKTKVRGRKTTLSVKNVKRI